MSVTKDDISKIKTIYDAPSTSKINVSNANTPQAQVTSTPIYQVPQSPTKVTTPVVTSKAAELDYSKKLESFNTLINQMAQQGSAKASQDQVTALDNSRKEMMDSENRMKQQEIDIQKQKADTDATTAKAKQDAVNMANGVGQTSPVTQIPTSQKTTAQSTGDIANQGISSATNQYQNAQGTIQQSKDTLVGKMSSQLDSLIAGTIPLTGPQHALINSLKTQLTQNKELQKIANESYTGAVTTAAFRSGGEYTPEQMAGKIQSSLSEGISKIQSLDSNAAVTIANLQQEFQKDNFAAVNKQYDLLTKQLDDKASLIKDTYQTTVKALQDVRDYDMKRKQDEITNQLASDKFTWKQKQDLVDNAVAQGHLSLDQAKFKLETSKYADEQSMKSLMMNNPGENPDALALANQFSQTGKIPTPAELKFANTSAGQVAQIAKEAPKAKGVIVNKNTGVADSKMSTTEQQDFTRLYNIVSNVQKLKDLDEKRIGGVVSGTLGKVFGSDDQAQYLTLRKAIVDDIARMQSGAALTPDEVAFYEDYLPGRFSETLGLGQDSASKIANFESIMNDRLKQRLDVNNLSIYGYSKVPIGGQEYTVGDVVTGADGTTQGRVNADGSITLLK